MFSFFTILVFSILYLRNAHNLNYFIEGVPDLLSLGDFNEGALLHTIRVRHGRN
jgi:hypothetical protein